MKTIKDGYGYDYDVPDDAEYSDAFEPDSPHYNAEWAKQARANAACEESAAEARQVDE